MQGVSFDFPLAPLFLSEGSRQRLTSRGRFICATRAANKGCAIIRSYPSRYEESSDCTIWQAAVATMALPPFFGPITIGSVQRVYADGSLLSSNPIWSAVDEARREFPDGSLACLVSLGTGQLHTRSLEASMTDAYQVCAKIGADAEATARLFLKQNAGLAQEHRYYRFNVEQGLQDVELDEFSPFTVDLIDAATLQYLADREEDLVNCVAMLKSPVIQPQGETS